jgi:hypothetical protein
MTMTEVRESGIKKGCAVFWIVLFILLFVGTVLAVRFGIINPDAIFHP